MTLNDRVRKVRKDLDLTQKEFGLRIGLKGNSIALIEGGRPTSDQTIYAICRTFNVSETWLRTGEGEMYESKGADTLGDYLKERGVTELEEEIIRAWMELPPKERRELLEHFQRRLSNRGIIPAASPAPQKDTPPREADSRPMTREELHAELDRQLDLVAESPRNEDQFSGRGA